MKIQGWLMVVAGVMSLPVWADDCYEVAREERREHCRRDDDECHERIDRQLKRCLAREGHEYEGEEAKKKPAPYVYIPGLPSTPTVMPGWR